MQLTRTFVAFSVLCSQILGAEPAASKTRQITLGEAIQEALQHNLDVEIQRLAPSIAQLNLNASYSVYEPQLSLNALHTYRSQPGGFDQFGRPLGAREFENDAYAGTLLPGISGIIPFGTQYRLQSNLSRNKVTTPLAEEVNYTGDWNVRVEQPLLRDSWIDAGRAQIQINRKTLDISKLALLGQVQQTIDSVEEAYYNLIFARENVKVAEAALGLADRTLFEAKTKVRVGTLPPLDEKQAEAQVATSKADLLTAQRNLALQENVLKKLITAEYATLHDSTLVPSENLVAVPITYNLQDSWTKGLTQRPDILQAKVDLERRDITLRYQKNQLFPALDLVGSYGLNALSPNSYNSVISDLTRDKNPTYSFGAVLSIPLGNLNPRNRYKASKAEKQQALLQYKKLEIDIMSQLDDAVKLAQTSFERVGATRQAREFAKDAMDAEQKKLENGKSTQFFVLQLQRNYTAAQFDEIRALAEYNIALAQLAFREGSTLERHRINLTIK